MSVSRQRENLSITLRIWMGQNMYETLEWHYIPPEHYRYVKNQAMRYRDNSLLRTTAFARLTFGDESQDGESSDCVVPSQIGEELKNYLKQNVNIPRGQYHRWAYGGENRQFMKGSRFQHSMTFDMTDDAVFDKRDLNSGHYGNTFKQNMRDHPPFYHFDGDP